MNAAVKGKKTAPQKTALKKAAAKKSTPKKTTSKKAAAKKAIAKKAAPKKQVTLRKPRQVESLMAGAEVDRKFTMTVHVSGREFLDDPIAATRRVLILALSQVPTKIHQQQLDNESTYGGMFNKGAETHFNGVLNDPKKTTGAGVFPSANVWEWRPTDR